MKKWGIIFRSGALFLILLLAAGCAAAGALQTTNTVLMVSPDHFQYNPQTAASNAFQHEMSSAQDLRKKALHEFDRMVESLTAEGIEVVRVPSREGCVTPDAIFPNNWFSLHRNRFGGSALVLYPMLTLNRRLERQPDRLRDEIARRGFRVKRVVDLTRYEETDQALEGTGSMVLDRAERIAYASLSPRTDATVLTEFCRQMNYRAVVFQSSDGKGRPIYHTNVMMSVGCDFAVVCLGSIQDVEHRRQVAASLQKTGKRIVEIDLLQMENMCGNVLELRAKDNRRIVVLSKRAFDHFHPDQRALLEQSAKLVPVDIATIENVGGGSARCMVGEVF